MQPNQAMVKVEENQKTLKVMLEQAGPQLAVMIPPKYRDVVNGERMALLALTTFSENEQLQKCTLKSIVRALLKAARLGLEPDGQFGQGWLMAVYNGAENRRCYEAQFRLGYQGKKTLAFRSGKVADILVDVVYGGDEFHENTEITPDGLKREFRHRPKRSKDRGPLVAAYAIATFKDGTAPHLTVLDQADIDRIKKRSESLKGTKPEKSPWSTEEAEMWKKSAVGRLCKELPQPDPANALAFERDEAIEAGDFPEDDDLPEAVEVEASRPQFVAPTVTVTPAPAAAKTQRKAKPAPAPSSAPAAAEEPPFDAPVDAEFEEAAPAEAASADSAPAAEAEPVKGDLTVDIGLAKSSAQLRKLGAFMADLPPAERARVAPVFNAKMSELLAAERAAASPGQP